MTKDGSSLLCMGQLSRKSPLLGCTLAAGVATLSSGSDMGSAPIGQCGRLAVSLMSQQGHTHVR